jgi:hypothetical protein
MPVYDFARKKEGAEEIVSANLSFRELEVYNLLFRARGRRVAPKEPGSPDDKESSLYDIILREAAGENRGEKAEQFSREDFRSAYKKLERSTVIEEENGRLTVLPRKYSSHPVIFNGPGFYSTDNRKGSKKGGKDRL